MTTERKAKEVYDNSSAYVVPLLLSLLAVGIIGHSLATGEWDPNTWRDLAMLGCVALVSVVFARNCRVEIEDGNIRYFTFFGRKKVDVPLASIAKGAFHKVSSSSFRVHTPQGTIWFSRQTTKWIVLLNRIYPYSGPLKVDYIEVPLWSNARKRRPTGVGQSGAKTGKPEEQPEPRGPSGD